MSEFDEYGLASHLVGDETWAALRGNMPHDPNDPNDPGLWAIRLRPVYRPPAPLHANSTPLERHAYKETKEVYAAFLKGNSALRHALLQSAGSANTMTMERAIGDLMDVIPREIYDQMHLLHGTLNLSDIEKLEQKLLKPLASIPTFEAHANTSQARFTIKDAQFLGFSYTAARVGILDSKSAPTEIPRGLKKKVGKKKVVKTTPKKRHEHCLLCWPAGAKKKVGVEQEEVGRVITGNALEGPSGAFPDGTPQHFKPGTCFLAIGPFIPGVYVLRYPLS